MSAAESVRAHLPEGPPWSDAAIQRLADRLAEARALWPGLNIADAAVVPAIAARLPATPAIGDIDALCTSDLFLACACSRSDPAALAAFGVRYEGEIRTVCARFADSDADEIIQRVRQKLFVDSPPAILSYSGRGSLAAWLRAIAVRLLINAGKRERRERPAAADFFDALVASDDGAELGYLKRTMGAELRVALLAALDALTNRERSLLRYAYCDQKNVDEIAAIFGVHRATAARWVVAAREHLVEHTHERLVERLGASHSEVRSIVRLGIGVIDTTFAKHLAPRR
jgi:RNA polymerase sigma-70 factor (ECF subfamily)